MEGKDEVAALRSQVAVLRRELKSVQQRRAKLLREACAFAMDVGRKMQRLQDRVKVAAVANRVWRDLAGEVQADVAASFAECADKLESAAKRVENPAEAKVWATAAVIVWAHAQGRHGLGEPPARKAAS